MRHSHPDPEARQSTSSLARLEGLFWEAVALPPKERDAFLKAQCASEPGLRREVERMIAADRSAGAFLEVPLPEVLAQDLPQSSLARWTLLERIGEGGLGVVYRAECRQDGVKLEAAVKILRPGFDTGKFRERFIQERQILAGLDHPGIVRLMDCGADESGRSFLVMEFVSGEPLDQYLRRTNPPTTRRLELFEAVCDAAGYLHSRFIAHGDIKPSNVLVTAAGAPKLVDFGAARLISLDTNLLRGEITRVMLTPLYASPEQKRGEGPSVPSDIYSLGRLLEEMVPRTAGPSDLRYILDCCMKEDPADRYSSAAEVVEDLRRQREGLPLRARPATPAYVTRRFLGRNWAVATLTALLVVSLAGGWWRAEHASRRASLAAAEAIRQHRAALDHERSARENEARAAASAREAISNAERLDALLGDLIDDANADPNILDQQQAVIESSLRRAAAALEALPGPPRWRQVSVAWRRVAMILVHRGEFSRAESAMTKARDAAAHWLHDQPSPESRRNALLVRLCEIRLERQSGKERPGYRLAHEALAEFATLPAAMQAELNGSVWLESARLAVVRELIDQDRPEPVPAILTEVVRNSHARGLTQTRNLGVTNLIWSLRRLGRLEEAGYWCDVARDWQAADSRTDRFCTEPLTAFTSRDPLFPVSPGELSSEDLKAVLSQISQLIQDRHEDPKSFPLNISLGRSYARLADHYIATEQYDLARPPVRQAAAIRDALVAADPKSSVVVNYRRRVDLLERRVAVPEQ
jgi:predicted Ser/Thr protein kinase